MRRGHMGMLIVAALIVGLVAIFSVQNALPVSIAFLFWRFQASLAVVIFISVLAGVIIASVVFLGLRVSRQRKQKKTGSTD
jgi:uncharacterized integral membrane protein